MDSKNNLIVGLGEVLWDVLPEGRKLGGAPANFAYNVRQFGFDSLAISAVGNDKLGNETLAALKDKGLDFIMPQVPYPTGTVLVSLDDEGIPAYDIRENVAWDNIPFTPEMKAAAQSCRAVCWGSLAQRNVVSRTTINSFLDAMPDGGGRLKVFDINLRQKYYSKQIIEESLKECNILKINDEELIILNNIFGYKDLEIQENCNKIIQDFKLKEIIVTCGAKGSYVASTEGTFNFEPTPKIKVADTVGAGDSFTAAYCSATLAGKNCIEAHKLAVEVSSYVCTCNGAMPKLPKHLIEKIR